jgi:hypothetical protein
MPRDFDWLLPSPTRGIIGQITHHLGHMAAMVYCIDENEGQDHDKQIAFVDSFLLDFRALYYFLLDRRQKGDAHRWDFLDSKAWQPPKTPATKHMRKLEDFISKHRAHLSMSRFVPEYQDLESLIGEPSITAEYLAGVLLDYLDILDSFIEKLPETRETGKEAWKGAAGTARNKIEVALGIRQSDYPESVKPLRSVQARYRQ